MLSRLAKWSRAVSRRNGVCIAALGVLPVAFVLLDFRPEALAGCGTYGYGCTQSACFTVEISTNSGGSWQKGSAWVYGNQPYSTINLYVRTTMTTNVDKVDGWSFGLKHTATSLISTGGNFVLNAVQVGPCVNTLQVNAPPDFQSTRIVSNGLTQGVLIDTGLTGYTTGPNSNIVTALSCYQVTFPSNSTVHTVTLDFTEDVGSPSVANLVSRLGQKITPCKEKLTLYVQRTGYPPFTPNYCGVGQPQPTCPPPPASGGGGGGGGQGNVVPAFAPASCADSNDDGSLDILDAVVTLFHAYAGGVGRELASTRNVSRTRQDSCFSESLPLAGCQTALTLGFPRQDARLQEGVPRSYIAQDGHGNVLPPAATDKVRLDTATSLMWQTGPLLNAQFFGSNVKNTFDGAISLIAAMNAGAGFAGFTGWRLPTVGELIQIMDYSKLQVDEIGLPVELGYPDTPASHDDEFMFLWTSTSFVRTPLTNLVFGIEPHTKNPVALGKDELAQLIAVRDAKGPQFSQFPDGGVPSCLTTGCQAIPACPECPCPSCSVTLGDFDGSGITNTTDVTNLLDYLFKGSGVLPCFIGRPEYPNSIPAGRFIVEDINGDVVLKDSVTGLWWYKEPIECGSTPNRDWQSALTAASQTYAGQEDWRLPNVFELATLFDFSSAADVVLPPDFLAMPSPCSYIHCGGFWTSTTAEYGSHATRAHAIALANTGALPANPFLDAHKEDSVRCVLTVRGPDWTE